MSNYQMKAPGGIMKKLMVPVVLIAAVFGVLYLYSHGYMNRKTKTVEVTHLGEVGTSFKKDVNYKVAKVPLPSGDELGGKMFVTIAIYDWHANTAIVYGNGGERTLENSIIGQEGLVVKLVHQDDTNITIKQVIDKIAEWKKSKGTSGGNLMFTIMGNSSVPLIEPLNAALKEIDPSFKMIAIDHVGKSNGEDQFYGPLEWLTNPQAMRGKIVVGVYDDGDVQGPAVMYAQKNDVPVNFDCHTYNPNALNIECVDDFVKAGKVFMNVKELDARPVVDDKGIRTGKTTKDLGIMLKPDSLASWTPVDRDVLQYLSQHDPGRLATLGTINSTGNGEEYRIMPATLLVFNKFAEQHKDQLVKLSYAIHKSAMQVDKYPDALEKAMELNTGLLGVWSGDGDEKVAAQERLKAFQGYPAPQNKKFHIGGSSVFSFRDAMNMVGMTDDGDDVKNSTYCSVYRAIGDLTIEKYPEKRLTKYTDCEQFFDTSILRSAFERAKNEGLSSTELLAKRDYTAGKGEEIGGASFQITFKAGSADFTPSASKVLGKVRDQYAASEYAITVIGHTDRTGSDVVNQPLSVRRAEAVKQFLVAANSQAFGGDRITTDGKGASQPPAGIDANYTGACDKCRRVEITISR